MEAQHRQHQHRNRDQSDDARPETVDQPADDRPRDHETERQIDQGAGNLATIPPEFALEGFEEDADAIEQQGRSTHRYSEQRGDQDQPTVVDLALPDFCRFLDDTQNLLPFDFRLLQTLARVIDADHPRSGWFLMSRRASPRRYPDRFARDATRASRRRHFLSAIAPRPPSSRARRRSHRR